MREFFVCNLKLPLIAKTTDAMVLVYIRLYFGGVLCIGGGSMGVMGPTASTMGALSPYNSVATINFSSNYM